MFQVPEGSASMSPDSPMSLIYKQIDRVLLSRMTGQGAHQAISGLVSLVEPWKDDIWEKDMDSLVAEDIESAVVWDIVQAVIRLLSRKSLWIPDRQETAYGDEFLGSL